MVSTGKGGKKHRLIIPITLAIALSVSVLSCFGCSSKPRTLEEAVHQDPNYEATLQEMENQLANDLSKAGIPSKVSVRVVDNQIQYLAYCSYTEESLGADLLAYVLTGETIDTQKLFTQFVTQTIDGRKMADSIYGIESECGIDGITLYIGFCDTNGNLMAEACYNDQGRVALE